LSVPSWSVPLFLEVPAKKRNIIPLVLNPGSCGLRGISGIPAGMHNLDHTEHRKMKGMIKLWQQVVLIHHTEDRSESLIQIVED
jgi:hypothetical protein